MNNPQKIICKIILQILMIDEYRQNLDRSDFKYILNQTIRQYPEFNDSFVKTWQKVDLYEKYHQFSQRAVEILKNCTDDEKKKDKDLWKKFHYEHIVPISIIRQKLLSVDIKEITYEKVCEIMKDNEVVILSKEEADVLDGNFKKEYDLDGIKVKGKGMKSKGNKLERLNSIDAKLHEDYIDNHL